MGSAISAITSPASWAAGQLFGGETGKQVKTGLSTMYDPANLTGWRPKPGEVGTDMGMSGGGGGYGGQMYDGAGRPILEDRKSLANADGTIQSQYQTKDATNMGAMDQARQEALRAPGQMSKWGQMALAQGQNQNAMSAAGRQSQALNGLAMQGGLRSGARERLAASGAQGQLQANQNTFNNIQNTDETNRVNQLQQQVGNEATYGQNANAIQNTNINRALAENQMGNDFNSNRYTQAMTGWAADKSSAAASAQARQAKSTSGLFGGGGFLGTGLGSK